MPTAPAAVITRLVVVAAATLAAVSGCAGPTGGARDTGTAASSAAPVVAPQPPEPTAAGPCPYLDARKVEQINGQRVGSVRVSADEPHPACFFERSNGRLQLRTWIVEGSPELARAAVDTAAPVATSDLAELPGGWSGGSQPTDDGAVFAVAEQGTAVIVTTNQAHTIAARRIAERVIANLGL